MNLLIKNVSEEEMKVIRLRAAESGQTIRDYVLGKCGGRNVEAVEAGKSGSGPDAAGKANSVRRVAKRASDVRRKDEAGDVPVAETSHGGGTGFGTDTEKVGMVHQTKEHEVKSCRIYKCGQCSALGHKDKNRGLE